MHEAINRAEAVRMRRAELGMTQAEAAQRAGVAVSTWRMIEAGRTAGFRTLTLVAVARGLGWAADALLHGAGEPARGRNGGPPRSSLESAIDALTPSDQLIVTALVDRLSGSAAEANG
jgi:DNA-binding XRE family transcriptional regulator